MTGSLADTEDVKRIAEGDKRALETLYKRHSASTFKFLLRLTANRTVAEDLTHDVFLEVWRSAGKFEGRSAVTTWILSIARYKALDAHRRTRSLSEEDLPQTNEPTPEQVSMKASSDNYMQRCLQDLSVEHREIIDLVYFHEKSIKEVSLILGIPDNTVKTRMFYARKKLKEKLQMRGDNKDAFSFGK